MAIIGLLISCSDPKLPSTKMNSNNENILHFDVYTPIGVLESSVYPTTSASEIFPLLYSFLCVPDASDKLTPDLAEKWHYDSGDATWTIYLNQNARFHNGQKVTSIDVKFSFTKFPELVGTSDMSIIKSISIVSESILKIKLTEDDPQFLRKVWHIAIVPALTDKKIDYYNHPIGSGPFRFISRNGENEVVLGAFKEHFRGRPAIDYVVYHFQPIKEKSFSHLLAGDTDVIMEISPKNFKILRNYPDRFYFNKVTLQAYTILLYNSYHPLFSDPIIRTALTYGINREYIVREILNGAGVVANGPMGVDSPYHNPKVKPLPYNPKKAVTLLKQTGWHRKNKMGYFEKNGAKFEFTLLVFKESQIEKKVARYIQLCLNEVGVRVRTKMLPYNELMGKYFRNTQFDAVLTELNGAYRNPIMALNLWAPIGTTHSVAGCFHHSEVTKLVHQIYKEADPLQQIYIYHKIDSILTSLQPGTFLFHKKAIDVMSRRFALPFPLSLSHEGVYRLQYAHLKNE
jgi:peptide/nickel transport system substrate-binding protein